MQFITFFTVKHHQSPIDSGGNLFDKHDKFIPLISPSSSELDISFDSYISDTKDMPLSSTVNYTGNDSSFLFSDASYKQDALSPNVDKMYSLEPHALII